MKKKEIMAAATSEAAAAKAIEELNIALQDKSNFHVNEFAKEAQSQIRVKEG